MATWWRQFQADADAIARAIEREHHGVGVVILSRRGVDG